MFCLRSWVFTLACLYVLVTQDNSRHPSLTAGYRTNASPIYIFLFLTATYILQRPCVYCSILLFVLIFSLFDFNANWFEPRWQPANSITQTATSLLRGNATLAEALEETASIALSALNGTGGSLVSMGLESARKRFAGEQQVLSAPTAASGFDWLRNILEKRQFRIPCVDVLVRL